MEDIFFFASGMLILANLVSILIAAWRLSPNGVDAPALDQQRAGCVETGGRIE